MFYYHAVFHTPNFSGCLVISITPKAKEKFHQISMPFVILEKFNIFHWSITVHHLKTKK